MNNIKKAINTGKMIPKRDILSMLRYEGKGLKKLGFIKQSNLPWKVVTWPIKKGVGYSRKAKTALKDNPVKSTGTALGWIFEPGYEAKNLLGISKEPNIFDDFVTFGFPTTALLLDGMKNYKGSSPTYTDHKGKLVHPTGQGEVKKNPDGSYSNDAQPGQYEDHGSKRVWH